MKLEPCNATLVVRACTDPRRQGAVVIEGNTCQFALVESVNESLPAHVAEVGDVVYWPLNVQPQEILVDGSERRWVIYESQVIARVRKPDVEAKTVVAEVNHIVKPNALETHLAIARENHRRRTA